MVYQPKINIADNTIFGTEVLIRWDRETKPRSVRMLSLVNEDIGFIKEISKFVLINTCRQIADWNEKGIDLNVSMNFTGNELLDDDFVEGQKVIQDYKINPSRLELEITERVISNNNEKLIERLHNFRAKGYKISIDDCGTGINSLVMMADTHAIN